MQSNQIIGININTGGKSGHYNIPDGDTIFPLGELESCFVKDGDLCIMGAIGTPGRYGYYAGKTQPLCTLFKTSIISFIEGRDLTSYGATTLYTNITVNGVNPKRFNPTASQLTTLDEAGSIASYLKSGTIIINNATVTPQVLYLVDGNYSIRGGSGNRNAYPVIVNSIVRGINFSLNETQLQHSIFESDSCTFNTSIELLNSRFIAKNSNFNLNTFNVTGRSPITLEECFYNNALSTYTQGVRIYSTITGRYQQHMFNYLQLFNARYYLIITTANYGIVSVALTVAEINANSWTKTARNNSDIKSITCDNGVITLTLEDDNEEQVTAGTLIQLIPCAS